MKPKDHSPIHQGTATSESEKIRKEQAAKERIPWQWLTDVENMLVHAFIDDATMLLRVRTKIACRGTPAKPVKITLPPNRKEKLNVAGLGDTVNHLAKIAERPLTAEEETAVLARFEWAKSNRDLLAHRMGRESATLRWKACPSDEYGSPLKIYQRRLAEAGKALARMGALAEPETHRWQDKRKAPVAGRSMEDRERDAQANAASLF